MRMLFWCWICKSLLVHVNVAIGESWMEGYPKWLNERSLSSKRMATSEKKRWMERDAVISFFFVMP